jgi:molecular chaperone DnaJ
VSDHYDVLGVDRNATAEEIKRAYRRLARELHPDVNPSDEASERFKLVTHAYDVLSDPDQRERYDLGPRAGFGGGGGFGFGDIFETFFGTGASGRSGPRSRRERGQDSLLRLEIALEDVVFGVTRDIEVDTAVVCTTCSGSCCAPGTAPVTCDICRGTGQIQRAVRSLLGNVMTTSPCGTCRGYGTVIPNPCPACAGQGRVRAKRTLTIDIPGGVDTGTRLHLPGEGESGPAGGPNGDVYLEIKVKHHATFSRNGDDLLATLEVQMTDAVLGSTATLASLDGDVTIEVKPGTQSADVVTIKDRGVTHLRGSGRGDLRIGIQVVTPVRLNSKEQRLMQEFAESRRPVPPEFSTFQQGLFAKLRDRFVGG